MAFVFNTPAFMPTSHPYDRASEGLRGGAALVVFGSHTGIATAGGVTAPAWVVWPMEGLVAVLVFFVLSGYVIGLNYPQARPNSIPGYLLRRVVRLWPIYIIGLALAFAVAPPVPVHTMLAHLFF